MSESICHLIEKVNDPELASMIEGFPKLKNSGTLPSPSYATSGSAGMDLLANIDDYEVLQPLQRKLIPTGISIALPNGIEVQIRPRSGLALKSGITVLNSPGTIDSDYRGEIGVILINLSDQEFVVQRGMRIAQMVFAKYEKLNFLQVSVLPETVRGGGGFGSTGI
jgi:dUTP pyrophosphatase